MSALQGTCLTATESLPSLFLYLACVGVRCSIEVTGLKKTALEDPDANSVIRKRTYVILAFSIVITIAVTVFAVTVRF